MSEPPIIKFKTRWNKIDRVEIERESGNSVWVKGRQRLKRTGFENYFDSFAEAKAFLLAGAERLVALRERQLDEACTELRNVQCLKETP